MRCIRPTARSIRAASCRTTPGLAEAHGLPDRVIEPLVQAHERRAHLCHRRDREQLGVEDRAQRAVLVEQRLEPDAVAEALQRVSVDERVDAAPRGGLVALDPGGEAVEELVHRSQRRAGHATRSPTPTRPWRP